MWGGTVTAFPQLSPRGTQEEEEGYLSNCHTWKKSAQSGQTCPCCGLGLGTAEAGRGLRSLGFEETLCACVLNYLCLSDEVSKRA